MADLAGLVVGTVALASLFTTCVDCFEYVQVARSYGKGVETAFLKLEIAQLRFVRWGESVRITEQAFRVPTASQREAAQVAALLGQIKALFTEVQGECKKFAVRNKEIDQSIWIPSEDSLNNIEAMGAKRHTLMKERHRTSTIKQKVTWALYNEKHFNKLIGDVSGFVKDLTDLFPAAKDMRMQLCVRDVESLTMDDKKPRLEILKEVTSGLDEDMKEAVTHAGHTYERNKLLGKSQALYGDHVASEFRGNYIPTQYSYNDNEASGESTAMYGNSYGGQSIFQRR